MQSEVGKGSRFTLSIPHGHRNARRPAGRGEAAEPRRKPAEPRRDAAEPRRPEAAPAANCEAASPRRRRLMPLSSPTAAAPRRTSPSTAIPQNRPPMFQEPNAPAPAASARRVVVCDDEPHITRAIALKLRRAGWEVETHPDGAAAWESVSADPPALLITDCQMPRMSGLDLLRRVRGEPATAAVPAIMLTGKGFELPPDALQEEVGPVQLYPKPFSPRALLGAVEELIAAPADARSPLSATDRPRACVA